MSEQDPKPPNPGSQAKPALTADRVQQLLREAIPEAKELDAKLKRVCELSEGTASLRLK